MSDDEANIVIINSTKEALILLHKECGEQFEFTRRCYVTECPYCKGDLIFPREDW